MVLFWATCKRIITTYQYQHKVNELWLNLPTQFALSARDLTHPILNPMRAGYCSIEFTESQTVGNFKPRTDLIVSIGSNNSLVGLLHFHMPAESTVPPAWRVFTAMASNLRSGELWYWKSGNILNWEFGEPCGPLVWNRLFLAESRNWSYIWQTALTQVFIQSALMPMSMYVHRVQINM